MPTHSLVNATFKGLRAFEARMKGWRNLTGNRFLIPHDTIPSNLTAILKSPIKQGKV